MAATKGGVTIAVTRQIHKSKGVTMNGDASSQWGAKLTSGAGRAS